MKTLFAVLLLSAMSWATWGCIPTTPTTPSIVNPSPLDGKPNSPSSWHAAHVTVLDDEDFVLDDGTVIKLFFTGVTGPRNLRAAGTLYVSVPSFDDEDDDNTYYFQKFVPDGTPASEYNTEKEKVK